MAERRRLPCRRAVAWEGGASGRRGSWRGEDPILRSWSEVSSPEAELHNGAARPMAAGRRRGEERG
jgi:hypothetical protein